MKKTVFTIVAVATVLLSSCSITASEKISPSEERVKKEYKLTAFDGVENATAIHVVYTQTDGPQSVVLDVPENILEHVNVEVRGSKLRVAFKNVSIKGNHNTTVYVSGPALHTFETSSAGSIYLKGGLTCDGDVVMETSSAGNISVDGTVKAKNMYLESSSAGEIKVGGATVEQLSIEASSAGDITVSGITADKVLASASSAGDITLSGVCKSFEKERSSAGSVNSKHLTLDSSLHTPHSPR